MRLLFNKGQTYYVCVLFQNKKCCIKIKRKIKINKNQAQKKSCIPKFWQENSCKYCQSATVIRHGAKGNQICSIVNYNNNNTRQDY